MSSPCEKKTKGSMDDKQVFEVDQKADPQEEVNITEVDESRSKKCLKDLNEELLCCICRELIVLAHTLPNAHTLSVLVVSGTGFGKTYHRAFF